jgi:SAM-dependent methyltransferase
MEKLLPDLLMDLWQTVDERHFTGYQFYIEEQRLIDAYRRIWGDALIVEGRRDLKESILWELGSYTGCSDLHEIERRAREATSTAKREWEDNVRVEDRRSVEQFYDETQINIYELMWWHALEEDASPLGYVTALQFARRNGCRRLLDFGAGVGSGGILFARNGLEVALADISSPMLHFSEWRCRLRRLSVQLLDLKVRALARETFDMISAMDVFEHLVDPASTVEALWKSLKPGGFLFGRFGDELDEQQPQHIVQDFGPTFRRMEELGFVPFWEDKWLWGHQAYRKS